ncbi:hypothetical protein A3D42_00685 [Candidatus Nomurabacteria bacterium RIFCSPHIGHO2_02_FULL_41_18]|uniref:Uncharacterized protein n=1 Tax=Candidatus Nomurabacteria bacterium RIFCSPHIGHO2_02_FULL_41_18 TaxID=1801754 RepID=A0A1F6W7D3_9BACT|nr:MAG: hypothetical protein A2737_03010 [Candidatus Nomurabacteria bacterium RIFCSPHIGHO2_01_FULL_41_71]OGI77801.1 MAG: hypothetical protein A3D42_00685 [Candidatus Nomurabacteria bacterium RIFCSPHIGHO2_02_FULL_41_18]OGI89932.1 MAG: hypothetical protein A3B01_01665 [Candidatus Nomurabacteria bacterium RIFCSPLOWO2_01_FULL_41_52b]OGJ00169.1 MAG: hypothetical protein A3I90_02990 [Candidatus Nomurabacteria bacterium RIFCSPLOWO2_02_FULL_41_9]
MNEQISGYKAVKRLAVERPDWLPIVSECLKLSKEIKGDFAGAWVYGRVSKKGMKFSNLRLLTSFGILKKEDTSRGGRRAYYSFIDAQGVEEALKELKIINENQTSST